MAVLREAGLSQDLADRDHYSRLVAIDESGEVVGFLDGLFDLPVPERAAASADPGPQAWGNWIAVSPRSRGCGVGQKLVVAFVTEAQNRGCTFFAAMLAATDGLAERLGFVRRCGLRDLVPECPDDIVGAQIVEVLAAVEAAERS